MKNILHYFILVNLLFITNESMGGIQEDHMATLNEHHRLIKMHVAKLKSGEYGSLERELQVAKEVGDHLQEASLRLEKIFKGLPKKTRKSYRVYYALMQNQYQSARKQQEALVKALHAGKTNKENVWVWSSSIENAIEKINDERHLVQA